MTTVYLIAFNLPAATRQRVKAWANQSELVKTWRTDLPGAFYVVSEAATKELAQDLHKHLGPRVRFLVTPVAEDTWGWLPRDTWHLFRTKTLLPKSARGRPAK